MQTSSNTKVRKNNISQPQSDVLEIINKRSTRQNFNYAILLLKLLCTIKKSNYENVLCVTMRTIFEKCVNYLELQFLVGYNMLVDIIKI